MISIIKSATIGILFIVAVVYTVLICSIFLIGIEDITKRLYKHHISLSLYFSTIRNFYCTKIIPMFYLDKETASKYTWFGKIIIAVFGFITFGIPLFLSCLIAIFIWIIIRIGMKLILK